MSDLHLGRHTFGFFDTIREDRPGRVDSTGWRCAAAAVDAARDWGATRLVAKGDLVDHASHDEWRILAELAAYAERRGLTVDVVAGNHEAKTYREVDSGPAMVTHGFEPTDGVRVVDLDGLRLLLIDTSWNDHHRGRLDHATAVDRRPGRRSPGARRPAPLPPARADPPLLAARGAVAGEPAGSSTHSTGVLPGPW